MNISTYKTNIYNEFFHDAPLTFDGDSWWYYYPEIVDKHWYIIEKHWEENEPVFKYAVEHNHVDEMTAAYFNKQITREELCFYKSNQDPAQKHLRKLKENATIHKIPFPNDPFVIYHNKKDQTRYTMTRNGLYDNHLKITIDGLTLNAGGYGDIDWFENL